jgi:hypothetical protein
MADNVEVKLGADASALKSGMAGAEQSSRQTLLNIANYLREVANSSKASVSTINGVLADLRKGFVDTERQAQTSTRASAGAMDNLSKSIVRAASAAVAAWVGHKAIQSIYDMQESVDSLQRVMGISADAATHMSVALSLAGSSADQFIGIALNIGRVIKTDSDEFARLGVTIKAANGDLLPTEQIMRNVYDRMLQFKAGADQTMFALALTGRGAKEFADMMENLERVQERATEVMKEFGIEMGPERQGAIKTFKTEMEVLGVAMTQMALNVGAQVMPALQAMGRWASDVGPTAIRGAVAAVKALISAFEGVVVAIRLVVETVLAFVGIWADVGNAIASVWDLIVGRKRVSEVAGTFAAIIQNAAGAAQRMYGIWQDYDKRVTALWANSAAPPAAAAPGGPKSGGIAFPIKPKGGGAEKTQADERLAIWRDELVRERELRGYFGELSKADEAAFWEARLALVTGYSKQDEKLRRDLNRLIFEDKKAHARQMLDEEVASLHAQIQAIEHDYAERVRLAQEAAAKVAAAWGAGSKQAIAEQRNVTAQLKGQADQANRIADLRMRMEDARANHSVDMAQQEVEQRLAMQDISAQQALALERTFEQQRFQIAMEGAQKRLAMAMADKDPVKIAQINGEIEQLEQQHQTKLTQIANAAARERAAASLEAMNSIRSGLSNALQMGMKDWRNWKEAGISALRSVADAITKMVADQWVKMLIGPGTAGGGILKNVTDWFSGNTGGAGGAAGGAGLEASAVALDSSALSLDMSALTNEAAGVSLTTAAVSLELAAVSLTTAATALAASGAASGIGSGIGSMIGNMGADFVVPGFANGTNSVKQDTVAMVHKGEAIIPARYNSSGGAGASGGVIHAPMSFNFSGPVDTRTQGQVYAAAYRGLMAARARNT